MEGDDSKNDDGLCQAKEVNQVRKLKGRLNRVATSSDLNATAIHL